MKTLGEAYSNERCKMFHSDLVNIRFTYQEKETNLKTQLYLKIYRTERFIL
jgi:hypothetical protein